MKNDLSVAAVRRDRWWSALNRFWFTPADPTLLGLIRICCGLVTFYTLLVYSFRLQDLMGEHAWQDLEMRQKQVYDEPRTVDAISRGGVLDPTSQEELDYNQSYLKTWKRLPPVVGSFPPREARNYIDRFISQYGVDPRVNGAPAPAPGKERAYLEAYARKHRSVPPAYPDFNRPDDEVQAEINYIDAYIDTYSVDPRSMYATGLPVWSIWFDITDPTGMAIVHGAVVFVAFLFTIGFCTRITSALTWMCSLWYIHRSPVVLFGVDTMQTILLLYLMIGPSGAALSVDRLIARWWSKNKPRVVNRWRALWGKPPLTAEQIVPAVYSPTPVPSVSANVAYRLLQIHVCIIYLIAGLAKLQGSAWWNGTAVWQTLANFEFAPMQYGVYVWFLKQLASIQLVFLVFLTIAGYFTLVFEIGYAFMIWRPKTRWWWLGGAIMLHGGIGLFMGLKTFSLMMLVMNMAFLTNQEVSWFLRKVSDWTGMETLATKPAPSEKESDDAPAPTGRSSPSPVPATAIKESVATKVKRK
jgi:hypothetical protein